MEQNDKKLAVVYKDFSFTTVNEDMANLHGSKPGEDGIGVLTVLPYPFYWNLERDDFTAKHNERMHDKVSGWIDGYKFANQIKP